MNESTALVVGATGLIGSHLIQQLLDGNDYDRVIALVRKWNGPVHKKLKIVTVQFDDINSLEQAIGPGNTVFSCIGTTQKKVQGDKDAYRKIDYDITVNTAELAIKKGYQKFMLVSAVGANKNASNFYLKLKGEIEEKISSIPFKQTGLFRPSVLVGERKEKRFGEAAGALLTKILSFILIGNLSKYKAIPGSQVAKAMLVYSLKNENGVHVYHYKEIISA